MIASNDTGSLITNSTFSKTDTNPTKASDTFADLIERTTQDHLQLKTNQNDEQTKVSWLFSDDTVISADEYENDAWSPLDEHTIESGTLTAEEYEDHGNNGYDEKPSLLDRFFGDD